MKTKQFFLLLLSVVLFAACDHNKLSAPTGLQGHQMGNTIVLAWNRVNDASSYTINRDGIFLSTTSSCTFTDYSPVEGFNFYEVFAEDGPNRSNTSAAVNVFYESSSSGDNGENGNINSGENGGNDNSNSGGNNKQESVTLSTPVVSKITSTSATITYDIEYSSANITAVGIMYALTSNLDYQYASINDANLATLKSSTSGSYTITFNLSSLNSGTQYVVGAFASTTNKSYFSSEKRFTTSSGSSGGGSDNLTVNKTNLTGVWTCKIGGEDYYWVLQSSGTAYSIVDESSYMSTGSYHKFVGTWTVSGSSFTFKHSRYYYYEGGLLDDNESDNETEYVTITSLTSTRFTDTDGFTWTKATLPSYVKL